MLPHLKRILSEGGIDVNVVFGPARTLSAADDRKAATQQAGELVRHIVAALNGGRDPSDVLDVTRTGGRAPQSAGAVAPILQAEAAE